MKKMHGMLVRISLGFLLFMMVSIFTPKEALAFKLVVENPFPDKMYFAVEELDDTQGWHVHGWWSVEPNSTKTYDFSTSTTSNVVYAYGYAGQVKCRVNLDGTMRPIVFQIFDYKVDEGEDPFNGQGQKVWFTRIPIDQDGTAHWILNGSD